MPATPATATRAPYGIAGLRTVLAVGLASAAALAARTAMADKGAETMKTDKPSVTMRGKPVVLLGTPVETGTPAPDFRVVDGTFQPVNLSDFKGAVVLISAVPSLDTPLCSLQTKRFNEEAAHLPSNVVVLAVSEDLPFAQKRFCESEKIGRIRTLSDSVWRDFGMKYGIVIENMGLLARSIWVVSADGRVVYRQIVPEITTPLDYDAALRAARDAAAKP
jgi:thiol peroxidase